MKNTIHLNIDIPKGYEIDKNNSTFERIVFVEIKKVYPKHIMNVPIRNGYYINTNSEIVKVRSGERAPAFINTISGKSRAKAFLALIQLLELRDAWNDIDNFKPDWGNGNQEKYVIIYDGSQIRGVDNLHYFKKLYFKSRETRDLFFMSFGDLLEKAKELL